MDPDAVKLLTAEMMIQGRRFLADSQSDSRMITGALVNSVLLGEDPGVFAGLNSGVRVPTTLNQPGTVVSA